MKVQGQYCKNKASPTADNFIIIFIDILQTAFIFQNVHTITFLKHILVVKNIDFLVEKLAI